MEKYVYDFGYFFNRKDSGSIFLAFDKQLDTEDVDECIEIACKAGVLMDEYASNIVYVTELTEDEVGEYNIEKIKATHI